MGIVPEERADGYGRARLCVGISCVGTMVVASSAALWVGLPEGWYGNLTPGGLVSRLAVWLGVYALLQLPFDWLGGYVLPRRYGRPTSGVVAFAFGWLRGVVVQGALLFGLAGLMTIAGHFGEAWLTVGVAAAAMLGQLALRTTLARAVAPLALRRAELADGALLARREARSGDESFTGGIEGVAWPSGSLAAAHWREVLSDDELACATRRREAAVASGLWRRGRVAAVSFVLVGVALAAWLTGNASLGTAGGTVELSLWFTLWSFGGLLVLPTFSRRAVRAIDERLAAEGVDRAVIDATTSKLNAMQDGQVDRSAGVEAIFHPIPSVSRRGGEGGRSAGLAAWDLARTAVYLGHAGLGLLGRAVHCNSGKPALWVYLPTD